MTCSPECSEMHTFEDGCDKLTPVLCEAAFIVFLLDDGSFAASVDLATPFETERNATISDVYLGARTIFETLEDEKRTRSLATAIRQAFTDEEYTVTSPALEALKKRREQA